MMTISTLVIVDLFFCYWTVMSVEVFGFLKYSQINFTIFYLVLLLAVGISFRSLDKLDFSSLHRRWLSAINVTNREIAVLGLFVFGAIFATNDDAISRVFVGSFLLALWVVLLFVNRFLPDVFLNQVFEGQNQVRLALVGRSEMALKMSPWLERVRGFGVQVVGLLETPLDREGSNHELPNVEILGTSAELRDAIREYTLTHLMLIDHRQDDAWVRDIAKVAHECGVRLWIYNSWSTLFQRKLVVERDEHETYFAFHDEPLENPVNRILKRTFDLIVAGIAMITVFPVVALFALIAQRIFSPGPLFFKQRRYGRLQRPFYVYKFRTMHVRPEEEAKQATKGDSRIFPGAGFLRKTSLDEIPQFINVLRSEMSVVGPRPHLDVHDEIFADAVELYRTRQYVKPGVTGLAQVRGYRGEIKDPSEIEGRVNLDIEYLSSWSLGLDILIVLRTFLEVVHPSKGAV